MIAALVLTFVKSFVLMLLYKSINEIAFMYYEVKSDKNKEDKEYNNN